MHSLIPVILCGGSGTRLWPLSREQYPKQLLPLLNNEDSLLQATARRMEGITGVQLGTTMVVCNEEYRFIIAEQLRVINNAASILLEPVGRNTAPALTIAALAVMRGGDDPILLVMPADHVITDTTAFHSVVHKSIKLAAEGAIITFGITPDSPETGYGYIQSGAAFEKDGFFYIERFVEKPDFDAAQSYLDAGSYLWNSGLFMMRASVWLSAIGYCRSDILMACRTAWNQNSVDGEFLRVERLAFEQCTTQRQQGKCITG
jgi:mannose-1-phosphate guanylyltransferase/mannose-6-phosphate isomerase